MGRSFCLLLVAGALAHSAPTLQPIAHWSFDRIEGERIIRDRTGNGHDGLIVRSKRLTGSFAPALNEGIHGQALHCGGSRQYGYYLSVTTPPELPGPFTICAWIKPSGGQWLVRIIYHKRAWHSRHGVELRMSGNRLLLVSHPHGPKKPAFTLPMKIPIQPMYWTFATICWDGLAWRLYMNAMLVAEDRPAQHAYEPPPRGTPLIIGGYSPHTNNTFTGLIDEVRIWPRTLSAREIEQVMLQDLP